MTYEVSIFVNAGRRGGSFEWVLIPRDRPGFATTYDWPGAKGYAAASGLPVRELDARGIVTREFYPSIEG